MNFQRKLSQISKAVFVAGAVASVAYGSIPEHPKPPSDGYELTANTRIPALPPAFSTKMAIGFMKAAGELAAKRVDERDRRRKMAQDPTHFEHLVRGNITLPYQHKAFS